LEGVGMDAPCYASVFVIINEYKGDGGQLCCPPPALVAIHGHSCLCSIVLYSLCALSDGLCLHAHVYIHLGGGPGCPGIVYCIGIVCLCVNACFSVWVGGWMGVRTCVRACVRVSIANKSLGVLCTTNYQLCLLYPSCVFALFIQVSI